MSTLLHYRLPLTSLNFLVLGKFEITKKKIQDNIVELGGTVAPTISYKVGLCVIPHGDNSLDNLSEKIRTHLEEKQIPVISENFVHKVKEKSKLVPVLDFLVSSWGQSVSFVYLLYGGFYLHGPKFCKVL